ncbi:MAG TPA: LuxR C-terminal-related transcriptional regulator [Jatrophihabitans sp.]|jgi:DNA-binding CsgD family transcriptional regulator|nr:LuxR C-terminal-related transcriptional regulator [Jatrophihabitans sp.]
MSVVDELVRARRTYEQGDWAAAFEALSALDAAALTDADLSALAMSAYLVGRRDNTIVALQQCYQLRVDDGQLAGAVRCAFWLCMVYANAGEHAVAGGWTGRALSLLDELGHDVVEHGYVRMLQMFGHVSRGEFGEVGQCAADVTEYGRRFADADLISMGLNATGRALVYAGAVQEGLARFDEAMIGIAAGQVSAPLAGAIYCSMIEACQEVSDFGRAAEWTAALSRWCSEQPGLLMFTGQTAVHRGQIMRLHGAYAEAIEEFAAAAERYAALGTPEAAGVAHAERGDVLRLQGRYDEAEAAYELASDHGFEPQPGLALLWLARGRTTAARAALLRTLAETGFEVRRTRLLPAAVEVLIATGELDRARDATRELQEFAERFACTALTATAAQAAGRLELEADDPAGALPYLRKAIQLWSSLRCPYEAARTRVLVGRACAALDDAGTSANEYAAARRTFAELGTAPALDEVVRLSAPSRQAGALTGREAEVLRLVASGKSNAQIAAALTLSERTVARHLSNIFAKIDVPSRTAAAAYAYEHGLA